MSKYMKIDLLIHVQLTIIFNSYKVLILDILSLESYSRSDNIEYDTIT